MSVTKLSITFFLQMFVILATCRVVGWLGQKYLKQPQVVGELVIAFVVLAASIRRSLALAGQPLGCRDKTIARP